MWTASAQGKDTYVHTFYLIQRAWPFLLFAEARMFWAESILAALTPLNLGLDSGLLYLSTRNAFVSF